MDEIVSFGELGHIVRKYTATLPGMLVLEITKLVKSGTGRRGSFFDALTLQGDHRLDHMGQQGVQLQPDMLLGINQRGGFAIGVNIQDASFGHQMMHFHNVS